MSDESDFGSDDDAPEQSSDALDLSGFHTDMSQSWVSFIDLFNRQPLLCDFMLGDQTREGAPVRGPDGALIPDPDGKSPNGFLMGPVGVSLQAVADAGRAQGELFRLMLNDPDKMFQAYAVMAIGVGTNLGHAGTFDYQRDGSYFGGYTQFPQFRDVSNYNVGVFMQQAGFSLDETLKIAGTFASIRSSNADTSQPYGLSEQTRVLTEQGYAFAASGAFDHQQCIP